MEYHTLFLRQQEGKDTDCSFIFKNDDGSEGETIHAHKQILSAVPYFETNFKSEWKGDKPILITAVGHSVFEKLIRAIYVSDLSFETLEEAFELYEAAHFYQAEGVLDLVREEIPKFCLSNSPLNISKLTNTAWKYQDFKLIQFSTKYFAKNAIQIIQTQDFLKFTTDSINFLFQCDGIILVKEYQMLDALERYVASNHSVPIKMLKPAIGAIRFLVVPKETIEKTLLLTEIEKNSLLGKNTLNFVYLSKNTKRRPE